MKLVKHFGLIIPKIYGGAIVTTGADVHSEPKDGSNDDGSNSLVTASRNSSSSNQTIRENDLASKEVTIKSTLSASENLEDLNLDDYVSFIERFNDKSLFFGWNCFSVHDEQYKVNLLKNLNKATLNDLILVFKMLTHHRERKSMNELKRIALKEKDCQNVLRLIEAWEEEDNEVCFTSKIFKEEYLKDAISILTKKSFEKLKFPQLIKFFKNCQENKMIPESLMNYIFCEFYRIEDTSYFISCQELKESCEILGYLKNDYEFFTKLFQLFYVRGSLNESEIVSIAKKYVTNKALDENIIDLMLINLMKCSHNFKFKVYVQILESITLEFRKSPDMVRPKILLLNFTTHCIEFNSVDKNTLLKFIICLRDNNMETLHSVIFEFLVEKVEMLFKCKEDMSDVIDEIIKCEDFMFNFISQFLENVFEKSDKEIELRCLIVERILHLLKMDNSSVNKISNFFIESRLSNLHKICCNSVVNRILLNLPTDFNETIRILYDMNLKRTLKKYLVIEVKRKNEGLSLEIRRCDEDIINEIFEKHSNLKFLKKSVLKALKNYKLKQKTHKYFNDKKQQRRDNHNNLEKSHSSGCCGCFKIRRNGCGDSPFSRCNSSVDVPDSKTCNGVYKENSSESGGVSCTKKCCYKTNNDDCGIKCCDTSNCSRECGNCCRCCCEGVIPCCSLGLRVCLGFL